MSSQEHAQVMSDLDLPAPSQSGVRGWWETPIGVITEPRRTFLAIGERPRLLVPLTLVCLLRFLEAIAFFQPDYAPWKLVLTFILQSVPVLLLFGVTTCFMWIALAAFGQFAQFAATASVIAHTFLVWGLARYLVGTTALLLGVDNPGAFTYTNAGMLVDDTNYALHHLASSVDPLTLLHLALIAYGLNLVARRRDLPRTATAVASVWVLYLSATTVIKVLVTG